MSLCLPTTTKLDERSLDEPANETCCWFRVWVREAISAVPRVRITVRIRVGHRCLIVSQNLDYESIVETKAKCHRNEAHDKCKQHPDLRTRFSMSSPGYKDLQ